MASFTRGDYGDENSIPRRINDDQLNRLISASGDSYIFIKLDLSYTLQFKLVTDRVKAR